jgi:hypothetical protein
MLVGAAGALGGGGGGTGVLVIVSVTGTTIVVRPEANTLMGCVYVPGWADAINAAFGAKVVLPPDGQVPFAHVNDAS